MHLEKEPDFLSDLCIVQGDVTPAAIIQSLNDNQGCSTLLIDEGILLYQKILNIEIHQINSAWSGEALNKTTIRGVIFTSKNHDSRFMHFSRMTFSPSLGAVSLLPC